MFEKITLTNDLDHMPAPYCYRFTLEIEPGEETTVFFSVQYYGREDLDLEEIIAEGFSENDDFEWRGVVPSHWKEEIMRQLSATTEGKNSRGVQIEATSNDKQQFRKPKSVDEFEFFVQELIQAIYEVSGKQPSLVLRILQNAADGKKTEYNLSISFFERKALLSGGNRVGQEVGWRKAQKALESVFRFDLSPVSDKSPKKEGVFIDPGEGFWYRVVEKKGARGGDGPGGKVMALISGLEM